MGDNDASEQTIYQYYTFVSENDSFVGEGSSDFTFINALDAEDEKDEVMYLSLETPDVALNSTAIKAEEAEEDVSTYGTKLQFILEEEQMCMKDADQNTLKIVDDTYTFDPELITTEISAQHVDQQPEVEVQVNNKSSAKNKSSTAVDENASASEESSNYIKVQLADGSIAFINNCLWHDLVENIKKDEKPKEKTTSKSKHKKFTCWYTGCGKEYSSPHHLNVHLRNHTGSRPYECPIEGCEKAFATGYSLKAHLRTHTGEAPYGCYACTKHFKTSGDLQKHVRTHTGEKPFKCPIDGCGRSFTTSNIRKVHIRSHTGERPYACTYADCKKAFASATNFKNHMRIHSGEKPYKCPVVGCGKCFTEYSSLFKHNSVHKIFTPLKCEYCSQLCKHASTLRAHKQQVHKIVVTEDGTEISVRKESDGKLVFL